jgi:hypothetical protein
MTPNATPEQKGYTFTLAQLIAFIFGPGALVAGAVVQLLLHVNTLENTVAAQEKALAAQTITLGKIQDIIVDVRLAVAGQITKPATTPAPAPAAQ